jgi:hypothetical protein
MYNSKSFICKHCNQKSSLTVKKKKLYDSDMDNSMSVVLLDYRIAMSKKSQTSSFLLWSELCDFYSQIHTKCEIFPKMFRIWVPTRVRWFRRNLFSLSNLMLTYHEFIRCKKVRLENVIAFFHYFAFRIACSKKMFYMSHRLDPKMYSRNLILDRKFSSMIGMQVLSRSLQKQIHKIKSLE